MCAALVRRSGGPGLLSIVAFQATLGQTYFIRVAGFMDNAGDLSLNIATIDGCLIDDICYSSGQANPSNACEACIPLLTHQSTTVDKASSSTKGGFQAA